MALSKREQTVENKAKFGYLGFTPPWLQWLNNPWAFLFGVSVLMFGQALGFGLLLIIMPQIEKRFNLSSFHVGMIAASNDVAAVVLGLFVFHYGSFGNKIKWIGVGGIVTGVGLIIFTLPHYIIGKYDPPPVSLPALLCTPPVNATNSGDCDEGNIAEWYYLALLLIGQFIAGVGTISLFSFSPAVFQECTSDKNLPIFLGIWQGAFFCGPLVAFGISEPLLKLYVDINQPEGLNMTPKDLRWIGNWWIGYIAAAATTLLGALFVLGFPQHTNRGKGREELACGETLLTEKEKIAALPALLRRLLTNWTYIFNSMGQNTVFMYGEGIGPFIAKFLIIRFGVAPEKVGPALTFLLIPPLIIGLGVGSLVTRAFKLENAGRKSAFISFLFQIFVIIGPMAFLIPGCNEINLAGWKVPYGKRTGAGPSYNFTEYPAIPGVTLGSTCHANCGCDLAIALPVCGSDNITYLSPCYAGCSAATSLTTFGNCSCVSSSNDFGGTATIGYCDRNCKNWIAFLGVTSLVCLAVFLEVTPSKFVLMRCIKPDDLPFAFGLQYMSSKVFAHIPGPIIFGHMIDVNCAIWQKVCDKTGYCWIYNMDEEMKMVTTITGTLAGLGTLFYFLSWLVYKDYRGDEIAVVEVKKQEAADRETTL